MGDVIEADEAKGGALGLFNGNVEGAIDGDDAVGSFAVDDPEYGGVAHDFGLFPADVVVSHTAGVAGDEPSTVRVVAVKVAFDDVVGDNAGVICGDTSSGKNAIAEVVEDVVLDYGHEGSFSWCFPRRRALPSVRRSS